MKGVGWVVRVNNFQNLPFTQDTLENVIASDSISYCLRVRGYFDRTEEARRSPLKYTAEIFSTEAQISEMFFQ